LEKLNLTIEKINNNLEKILETIGYEIVKETSPIELVTNVEKDNQKDIAQDDISLLQDQLDLQNISVNDLLS
jgi:predicted hydrocarbon binding protein